MNRSINIENASKRMSDYSSCVFILTQLIGFDKSDNGEKITLSDQVEIDTLVQLKNCLQYSNIQNDLNDGSSSYEVKKIKIKKQQKNTTVGNKSNSLVWSCKHCTYNNPSTCQICGSNRNVCVNKCEYYSIAIAIYVLLCNNG